MNLASTWVVGVISMDATLCPPSGKKVMKTPKKLPRQFSLFSDFITPATST
jgi:hypothetical protein